MPIQLDADTHLQKALEAVLSDKAPRVVAFGVNKDALWDFDALREDAAFRDALNNGLVLIWNRGDKFNDIGEVHLNEHLNPLTWCSCALRKFPCLRVAILDMDPVEHSQLKIYKVVEAVSPKRRPFWLLSPGFSLRDDLIPLVEDNRKPGREWTPVDLMMAQIATALTDRGQENNHHALVSIVGPLVLMDRMGVPSGTLPQKALRALFGAVGLLKTNGNSKNAALKLELGDLRLVLFDDQSEQGWMEWLKASVTGGLADSITALSSPEQLEKYLHTCTPGVEEKQIKIDRRFILTGPGLASGDPWALLLDLHLFRPIENGKAFYRSLVEQINTWGFTDKAGKFAWPSIDVDEVRSVAAWTHGAAGRPSEDVLLTLLPRFLALLDPGLPIIIFSTTLQRPLLEKLKPYGNIFTGLNKNPFSGGVAPQDYLRDIWPQVKQYVLLRRKISELRQMAPPTSVGGKYKHWEIYIDESGKPEQEVFKVAALLIGYKDVASAQKTNKELTDAGIRWDETSKQKTLANPSMGLGKAESEDDMRAQWGSILPQLNTHFSDAQIFSLCLVKPNVKDLDSDVSKPDMCNPEKLDNRYFSMLADLLETAIFDVLDGVVASGAVTIGVYAGTRLRVIEKEIKDLKTKWLPDNRKTYAAFGVNLFSQENRRFASEYPVYQAMGYDGLLPVLSELLGRRKSQKLENLGESIKAAAGIPLNQAYKRQRNGEARFETIDHKEVLTSPPYRHVHFVADILARIADPNKCDYGVVTNTVFGFGENCGNMGLFASQEKAFLDLQHISRLLDEGPEKNILMAFWLYAKMGKTPEKLCAMGIAARCILARLRAAVEREMTGMQMRQFTLAAPEALLIPPALTGAIKKTATSYVRYSTPAAAHPPGCASTEMLKSLKEKWRIARFTMDEYKDAKQPYYRIPGFTVIQGMKGIRVYADLSVIGTKLEERFVPPLATTEFTAVGKPLGRLYRPT